jgi:hypothetical protein
MLFLSFQRRRESKHFQHEQFGFPACEEPVMMGVIHELARPPLAP